MNTLLILGIKMEYSRVLFRKKMAPTNDSTGKNYFRCRECIRISEGSD